MEFNILLSKIDQVEVEYLYAQTPKRNAYLCETIPFQLCIEAKNV